MLTLWGLEYPRQSSDQGCWGFWHRHVDKPFLPVVHHTSKPRNKDEVFWFIISQYCLASFSQDISFCIHSVFPLNFLALITPGCNLSRKQFCTVDVLMQQSSKVPSSIDIIQLDVFLVARWNQKAQELAMWVYEKLIDKARILERRWGNVMKQ